LIRKIIDILSEPQPLLPPLADEVKRFIEAVFEAIDWEELQKPLLPGGPFPGPFPLIPKFIWDYYSGLLRFNDLDDTREFLEFLAAITLRSEDLVRQGLWITQSQWPWTSPFLQPRIGKVVSTVGSVVLAGSDAWSAGKSEWDQQQGRKNFTNYSDTQIFVHSASDAIAEGVVSFLVIQGVGYSLNYVPFAGPLLSVGYQMFIGPPVADFVNKNFTAPIMDKKYVEDGIDKGYEIARAVLGKTVYGAGEMVSIGGDTISRVGETASSVGEKIEDAGKKLQAWSGRLFG
jgi:hypothetical protein